MSTSASLFLSSVDAFCLKAVVLYGGRVPLTMKTGTSAVCTFVFCNMWRSSGEVTHPVVALEIATLFAKELQWPVHTNLGTSSSFFCVGGDEDGSLHPEDGKRQTDWISHIRLPYKLMCCW